MIYDNFAPTETPELTKVLDLMNIQPNETFCDLGSGDGRVVAAAAQRGAIATGIEYDPALCSGSIQLLQDQQIANAQIIHGDLYLTDFTEYDILYTNLTDDMVRALWDKLVLAHQSGSRIYMYMGVQGFGRCSQCYPILYEQNLPNVTVHTFDLLEQPWFISDPAYGVNPTLSVGRVYKHIFMVMN